MAAAVSRSCTTGPLRARDAGRQWLASGPRGVPPPPFGRSKHGLILAQQRSAALKLDWAKVTSSLGLRGQTAASLQAFKKRNEDARRKLQQLAEQPSTVDFAHYRSVLKNQAIVDEIERRFKSFKPVTYDLNRQLKAIDAFEAEAVKNAEATKQAVDLELKDLTATLTNMENTRPFEDLTVVCSDSRAAVEGAGAEIRDRTRSAPPSRPSTRRRSSSLTRAVGTFPATRCTVTTLWCRWKPLTPSAGEIRQHLPHVTGGLSSSFPEPPRCTLAL